MATEKYKNFHGIKGRSGRKSHQAEREDFLYLLSIWRGEISVEEVEKIKLSKKGFGAKHVLLLKILEEGDTKALKMLMDKLFPNIQELSILDEVAERTYNDIVAEKMSKFGVKVEKPKKLTKEKEAKKPKKPKKS